MSDKLVLPTPVQGLKLKGVFSKNTIKVTCKEEFESDGETPRALVIKAEDFDEDLHELVEDKPKPKAKTSRRKRVTKSE